MPNHSHHTVQRFDDELNEIAALVDSMGELAIDQLRRAVQTLKDENTRAAQEVITRDRALNDLDVEIDEKIILLIARRQPMAKDLREIVTIGKVVTDLERAGDEARKIAGLTRHFYDTDTPVPNEHILQDIYTMAAYVERMLERAMASFRKLDIDLAIEVLKMDEELEVTFSSMLRRLTTFVMEDARCVGHFVDIVLGIRALERYGGHGKNIAGHVIFLARGHDVRHEKIAAILEVLAAD